MRCALHLILTFLVFNTLLYSTVAASPSWSGNDSCPRSAILSSRVATLLPVCTNPAHPARITFIAETSLIINYSRYPCGAPPLRPDEPRRETRNRRRVECVQGGKFGHLRLRASTCPPSQGPERIRHLHPQDDDFISRVIFFNGTEMIHPPSVSRRGNEWKRGLADNMDRDEAVTASSAPRACSRLLSPGPHLQKRKKSAGFKRHSRPLDLKRWRVAFGLRPRRVSECAKLPHPRRYKHD